MRNNRRLNGKKNRKSAQAIFFDFRQDVEISVLESAVFKKKKTKTKTKKKQRNCLRCVNIYCTKHDQIFLTYTSISDQSSIIKKTGE